MDKRLVCLVLVNNLVVRECIFRYLTQYQVLSSLKNPNLNSTKRIIYKYKDIPLALILKYKLFNLLKDRIERVKDPYITFTKEAMFELMKTNRDDELFMYYYTTFQRLFSRSKTEILTHYLTGLQLSGGGKNARMSRCVVMTLLSDGHWSKDILTTALSQNELDIAHYVITSYQLDKGIKESFNEFNYKLLDSTLESYGHPKLVTSGGKQISVSKYSLLGVQSMHDLLYYAVLGGSKALELIHNHFNSSFIKSTLRYISIKQLFSVIVTVHQSSVLNNNNNNNDGLGEVKRIFSYLTFMKPERDTINVIIDLATVKGLVTILEYIYDNYVTDQSVIPSKGSLSSAVMSNHMETIRFLYSRLKSFDPVIPMSQFAMIFKDVLFTAISSNRMEIVLFIIKELPTLHHFIDDPKKEILLACQSGSMEMVQYLYSTLEKNYIGECDGNLFQSTIEKSDPNIIQFLLDTVDPYHIHFDWDIAFTFAILKGLEKTIVLIHKALGVKTKKVVLRLSMKYSIIKHLKDNHLIEKIEVNPIVYNSAAEHPAQTYYIASNHAIDHYCKYNDLALLEYLYERGYRLTQVSLEGAIESGNPEIVKWVLDKSITLSTSNTYSTLEFIKILVRNNMGDMIKLYFQDSLMKMGGLHLWAFTEALQYGHTELACYLYDLNPRLVSSQKTPIVPSHMTGRVVGSQGYYGNNGKLRFDKYINNIETVKTLLEKYGSSPIFEQQLDRSEMQIASIEVIEYMHQFREPKNLYHAYDLDFERYKCVAKLNDFRFHESLKEIISLSLRTVQCDLFLYTYLHMTDKQRVEISNNNILCAKSLGFIKNKKIKKK